MFCVALSKTNALCRRSKLKVAIVLLAIVLCIQTIKSATCGNGIIETGEAWDDGNSIMSDGCTGCTIDLGYTCTGAVISVCTNTYHWGNGVRESPEQCDDGNNLPFDGWDPTCKVYTGWTCSGNTPDVCTEICGDGLDFHKYAWDDGNTLLFL